MLSLFLKCFENTSNFTPSHLLSIFNMRLSLYAGK